MNSGSGMSEVISSVRPFPACCGLPGYACLSHYDSMHTGLWRDTAAAISTAVWLNFPSGYTANVDLERPSTKRLPLITSPFIPLYPFPFVLDVLPNESGETYFLMTRLPGQEIAEMPRTLSDYTDEELDVFVTTVGGWLRRLRALGPFPHGDAVCGFICGPFYSYRIKHDEPIGPLATQDEFHAQWYNTLPEQSDPGLRAVAARLRSTKRYRLCFTHGDISPNNILVDDNYKPVGLIDFGCAGWMPEYWEFTYAIYRRQRYRGWVKALTQIFPEYEDDLAVEMEQWKYISPW